LAAKNAADQGAQFALSQLQGDATDIHTGVVGMLRDFYNAVLANGQ
jgi:hypothetical protein